MFVSSLSKLCFLKVDRYRFNKEKVFNFLNYPRPHYCIGLVLMGQGEFCEAGEPPVLVRAANFKVLQQNFAFAEAHYNKTQAEQLQVLSIFYRLLANLLPRLCKNKAEHKPQIFRNPTSDQPASVPTWVKKAFV